MLRRLDDRKPGTAESARATIGWGETWEVDPDAALHNVEHWHLETQGPSILVLLVFEKKVEEGHILVASTTPGLRWQETSLSARHVVVRLDGRQPSSQIHVEVVAASAAGPARRQQPNVWQDAISLTG